MAKLVRADSDYPNRRWTDDEAREIIKKVEAALNGIEELKQGTLYYFGISVPTNKSNEAGATMTRTAHFLTAHPHTAGLIVGGLAAVHPMLLPEMAAQIARLSIMPMVNHLAVKQAIDEANATDEPDTAVPDSEGKVN